MQKHINLVDLVKTFPTNIFLQNLASIQKRTSPVKFDHLSEKSEKGSISNLSTKRVAPRASAGAVEGRTSPSGSCPGNAATSAAASPGSAEAGETAAREPSQSLGKSLGDAEAGDTGA